MIPVIAGAVLRMAGTRIAAGAAARGAAGAAAGAAENTAGRVAAGRAMNYGGRALQMNASRNNMRQQRQPDQGLSAYGKDYARNNPREVMMTGAVKVVHAATQPTMADSANNSFYSVMQSSQFR